MAVWFFEFADTVALRVLGNLVDLKKKLQKKQLSKQSFLKDN